MKKQIALSLTILLLLSFAAVADDKDKNKSSLYEKKGDKERIYKLPY